MAVNLAGGSQLQEAAPPLQGAHHMVELQSVLEDTLDNVYADFLDLAGGAPSLPDHEKKRQLLLHLHGSRQQLLRMLAVVNWRPWKVLQELVDNDRVLGVAASHVNQMNSLVTTMKQQAIARVMAGEYLNMYDVNTALEVLTTGSYQELPNIILHQPPLFQPPPAPLVAQRARLAHVTHLIRARLAQTVLPPGLTVVSVVNGCAILRAEGLYEARVTLVPAEPLPQPAADEANSAAAGLSTSRTATGGAEATDVNGAAVGALPVPDWVAAAAAAAASDPACAVAQEQRWKWRLLRFVLLVGVPFYHPAQPGQILHNINFHMVLSADNAAYLALAAKKKQAAVAAAAAPGEDGAAAAAAMSPLPAQPATSVVSGTSALSNSSGLAGFAGGASMASLLKRAEGDEVGAPLAIMHAILTDIAGRLLADEVMAAAKALAAPGSRWADNIRVSSSTLLRPGVRVEYWTKVPPLLNLRAMLTSGASEDDLQHARAGPPCLEIGMGEGGRLEVLHFPSSLHKPMNISKLRLDTWRINMEEVLLKAATMSAQYQLLLVRSELKQLLVEMMGPRAPTLRLTTLACRLACKAHNPVQFPPISEADGKADADGAAPGGSQQQQPGEAGTSGGGCAPMDVDGRGAGPPRVASPPPQFGAPHEHQHEVSLGVGQDDPSTHVLLATPVLEYLVHGTTELKVVKHLFSGRLTLRPGQDERDEGSLDHAATTMANEEVLNAAALAAWNKAGVAGAARASGGQPGAGLDGHSSYPCLRPLQDVCRALARLLQRIYTSTDATHFIQAARRAALHNCKLPPGLLDAFNEANPAMALDTRPGQATTATWALQTIPFPSGFPPLEAMPADTPSSRVPQCLAFFLLSKLTLTSTHMLVACSCNKQLMPIKIITSIPVPPETYKLADGMMAAYLASAGARHPHHAHPAPGAAATQALHSTPQGGAAAAQHHHHQHLSGGGAHPGSPAMSPAHPGDNHAHAHGHGAGEPAGPFTSSHVQLHYSLSSAGGGSGAAAAGATTPMSARAVTGVTGASGRLASTTNLTLMSTSPSGSMFAPGRSSVGGAGTAPHGHGSHHNGRPTGQQVAVMLAQQQLSSVVNWCRQRMVWEVLLVQLQAVGAQYVELASPPCHRLRVVRLAGTALPCYIVRRPGLVPQHVGPLSLELEIGPDVQASQVTARLHGTFFSCAQHGQHGAGGGGRAHVADALSGPWRLEPYERSAAGGSAAQRQADGPPSTSSSSGSSSASAAGAVCLTRVYCLERGESALTVVQEVASIMRMQVLLARLEMTARGRQQLVVLRPSPLQQPCAAAAAAAAGRAAAAHAPLQDVAAGGAGPLVKSEPMDWQPGERQANGHADRAAGQGNHLPDQPMALADGPLCKKPRLDPQQSLPQAQAHGQENLPNGHLADGLGPDAGNASTHQPHQHQPHLQGVQPPQPAQQPPQQPLLSWHWPLVGTVSLMTYSCSAAVLHVTPPRPPLQPQQPHAANGFSAGIPAPKPDPDAPQPTSTTPVVLTIHWAARDGAAVAGSRPASSAMAAAPATPSVPPTPSLSHGLSSSLSISQSLRSPGAVHSGAVTSRAVSSRSAAEPFGSVFADLVLCTLLCSSHQLPPEVLHSMEDLAENGEEGKLLDVLAVATLPMAGFCAALRPAALAALGAARGGPPLEVRQLMHQPPYNCRTACRVRNGYLMVDLQCQAIGRSYLKVTALPVAAPDAQQPGAGAAEAAADGGDVKPLLANGQQGADPTTTDVPAIKQEGGEAASAAVAVPARPMAEAAALLPLLQQVLAERLRGQAVMSVVARPPGASAPITPHRTALPAPGPGAPLWVLVPNGSVQQALEVVLQVAAGLAGGL